MPYLSQKQLQSIGFKSLGLNVLISDKASIYNPEQISIGSNVRIDDFCILSGTIDLGSYIHISAYSALYGKYGIVMNDYTGLSPRCTVFSATDDFSGDFFIGPMIDSKYTNVMGGVVRIEKYSQIGAGCVILPNITINEGVAVGAMSFVNKNLDSWTIYAGTPIRKIKNRTQGVLELEKNIVKQFYE